MRFARPLGLGANPNGKAYPAMHAFALTVFIVHTLFELAFGLRAYITGGSSSQTRDEIAAQPPQATIAARFLGSALTALGLLGLLVIVWAGPTSPTARLLSVGFALFHGLGALGVLRAAATDRSVLAPVLTRGALITHGALAIAFALLAFLLDPAA